MQAQSINAPEYHATPALGTGTYLTFGAFTPGQVNLIRDAFNVLDRYIAERNGEEIMHSPQAVRDWLRLRLATERAECFAVVYLDAQNRVIGLEIPFRGTLTQTPVYPRELVRRALELDAAAVILCHNHPSGTLEPSRADEQLTETVKRSLALVDVKVLDHIIVSAAGALSLAERGLI